MVRGRIYSFLRKNLLISKIVFILTFISMGALLFNYFEGRFYFDSLYYIVITLATIGYGDFVPVTTIGKILAIIYAFTGVPLFISISSFILEARFNRRIKKYIHDINKEILQKDKQILEKSIESIQKK